MAERRPLVVGSSGLAELPAGDTLPAPFTQTTTKTAAYTAQPWEIVPVDTSAGTVPIAGPTSGAPFGVRWRAGAIAPTVTPASGFTINGAASLTLGLPPSSTAGEMVAWQAFGTDYQPVGGFKPESALDRRFVAGLPQGWDVSPGTDGTLSGQQSADGNSYFVTGAQASSVVSASGLIGLASGVTTGNAYIMSNTAATSKVMRHKVDFILDASDTVVSGICFGVFDSKSPTAASFHCSIQPHYLRMSSFNNVPLSTYEVVHTPVGWPDIPSAPCRFPRAIAADGVTRCSAEGIFDSSDPRGTSLYLILTFGSEQHVLWFAPHPHFAQDLRYPFFQIKVDNAGDPNPRYPRSARAWDADLPALRAGIVDKLTLARATALRPQGGSGLPHLRPPSRSRGGATWSVPDQTITLTAASAAPRTDSVGTTSGSATVTDTTSRTDSVGTTSGSPTVTDTTITAADQGRAVSGAGIPSGSYVGTVTPNTSFLLSSSATTQTNVNATATATGVSLTVLLLSAADQGKTVVGTGIPANSYVGTVTVGQSFLLSSSATAQTNVNATATGSAVSAVLAPDRVVCAHPVRPGTRVTLDTGTAREVRTTVGPVVSGTGFAIPFTAPLAFGHASGASLVLPAHETWSDGTRWTERATGRVVSNLLPPAVATCHEPSSDVTPFQLTRSEVRAPTSHTGWRSARVQKGVATLAGPANVVLYITGTSVAAVTGGEPYAVLVGQAAMQVNARTVYVVVRWSDAAGNMISDTTNTVTISAPTSGTPVLVPALVTVAPANAATAALQLWATGLVQNDVLLATELCIASAHGPTLGYIAA